MSEAFEQAVEILARRLESPKDVTIERILDARDEVLGRYGDIFAPERITELKEEEFAGFLDFENNQHWSGLHRQKGPLCKDMDRLRKGLDVLLDEDRPLAPRFTEALGQVRGLGPAIATAILHVTYPDRYGVWNGKSEEGLKALDLWPETEPGASEGETYAKVNRVLNSLAERLDTDLWTLDVLWEDLSRAPENGDSKNVWLLAPGKQAKFWDDWIDRGFIAIGWDSLGDLTQYEGRDDIRDEMEEIYGGEASPRNDSLACWEFANEMEAGDIVFIKQGQTKLLGVGIVRSGYRFDSETAEERLHRRDVEWLRVGEWETAPRCSPRRSRWPPEKKRSDEWRSEPRQLPQKALTEITDYDSMVAELSIRVGLNEKAAIGQRAPLPIDEEMLDATVRAVIQREIETGVFEEEGREAYLHQSVLPEAQKALIQESIEAGPKQALKTALHSHVNLLHSTEIVKATDFIDEADEDELRERVGDLLFGEGGVEERAGAFLDWGGRQDGADGESVGFNGTAASFLLAMDTPATQAFCKPTVYKQAVSALLGEEYVVDPSDEARRIAHASRFYGELARWMRRQYDLPITDLLHVHSLLYLMSDTSDTEYHWGDLETASPPYSLVYRAQELPTDVEEHRDLLLDEKQIIFAGPPGTSKTYGAFEIVSALGGTYEQGEDPTQAIASARFSGDSDTKPATDVVWDIVQFHQSYGYEDFVSGIEADTVSAEEGRKQLTFDREKRIFLQLVEAAQNRDIPHVLIIDEINRGVLGRVFGELILTLEYRNLPVRLPGQNETIEIPENLYLIGTMNTADRNISLVDHALRRRFHFVERLPEAGRLNRYLQGQDVEDGELMMEAFQAVQSAFKGEDGEYADDARGYSLKDYAVGHTYFMVESSEKLWRNLTRQVIPLLEEYQKEGILADTHLRKAARGLTEVISG